MPYTAVGVFAQPIFNARMLKASQELRSGTEAEPVFFQIK
jgi:hypothetical protein